MNETTGWIGAFLTALFVVVGVLSATGKLPNNPLVGVRTATTMSSDEAWKAAHRAAAWSLFVAAAVIALSVAIAIPGWPLIMLAVLLVGAVQAQFAARRVTKGQR
jgi:uncharacterized membrane protein